MLNKKTISLIFILILVVGAGALWYAKNYIKVPVVENNGDGSQQINNLPAVSILKDDFSCQEGNSYAKFNIFKDGQEVNSVIVLNCEFKRGEVLAVNSKSAYFSILPGGMGGYIIYPGYVNLYKLNFIDNSITKVLENKQFMFNIDFTPNIDYIVYNFGNKIILRNLDSGEEKLYELSVKTGNAQFGDFKFSPNLDKVAIAAGYGPDNEYGEIYILNLKNGSYILYKKTDTHPRIEKWLNNDELTWY